MAIPYEQDSQMQQYFSTLPPMIQESILQSGIPFQTEEELRQAVENLMDNKNS